MTDYEENDRVDEYREVERERERERERSLSPDRRDRSYDRQSLSPRRDSDKPLDSRDDLEPMETEEDAKNEGTNLFVTGLSKAVTEPELAEVFSKYGVVDKCQIMVDPHTKESRGFGFVNMLDVAGADGAISSLNGFLLAGRTLSIEKAKRKRPRTPTPGKYFGPSKARRGRPRFDDRYRDRRYYGGGRRYDDRPRYDDPYRRPRFEERDEYRDRYYRDRGRERIDRGERYSGPRYEDRERYGREYREPYDRRYSREERLPIRDHRDERYRDDRDRYPAPLPPSDGYREREDYRP